jgi:phage protein U
MYALLGDIAFDLITYFDGFDLQSGADYAEHALIEGKPRLQFTADKLDEIRIALTFHVHYCDPQAELDKLKKALTAHQAMALVFGNGDYKGWFILTDVQTSSKQTDKTGTLIAVDANITLREYVGDKKNPLPLPAVQPKLPPAAAKATPQSLTPNVKALAGTANALRDNIRQAVSFANQAQSALKVATDAVRVAQQLRSNPLAALGRVPGFLTNMKQVADPLAKLSPVLAGLNGKLPVAADILKAGNNALGMVRNAQQSLSGVNAGTVVSRIDYMTGQLSAATRALESAAPTISKLASHIVTRKT